MGTNKVSTNRPFGGYFLTGAIVKNVKIQILKNGVTRREICAYLLYYDHRLYDFDYLILTPMDAEMRNIVYKLLVKHHIHKIEYSAINTNMCALYMTEPVHNYV